MTASDRTVGTDQTSTLCCIELLPGARSAHSDATVLRGVAPVSAVWGVDRGLPIDRHYIHGFLRSHCQLITGAVLEVKEAIYTRVFGHDVGRSEIVDIDDSNPYATIVADIGHRHSLPESAFDCIVLTQTLQLVRDLKGAIENLYHALKPGGTVLASMPCVSRVDPESGLESDFWRWTAAGARELFRPVFGDAYVEVNAFGNVLVCSSFLYGLAAGELSIDELDHSDPMFPLVVCVCARKSLR